MDDIARRAVRQGADPMLVVQAATHRAAQDFRLYNRGAIEPGYLADFAVLDDLRDFRVRITFKQGRLIYDGGAVQVEPPSIDRSVLRHVQDTFHLPLITAELALPIAGLISDAPLPQVNEQLEAAKAQAFHQGVHPGIDPFMTLSFMSLSVIPALRLLTRDAFDVETWRFIE